MPIVTIHYYSDVTKLVEIRICLMRIMTYKTCGMRM